MITTLLLAGVSCVPKTRPRTRGTLITRKYPSSTELNQSGVPAVSEGTSPGANTTCVAPPPLSGNGTTRATLASFTPGSDFMRVTRVSIEKVASERFRNLRSDTAIDGGGASKLVARSYPDVKNSDRPLAIERIEQTDNLCRWPYIVTLHERQLNDP